MLPATLYVHRREAQKQNASLDLSLFFFLFRHKTGTLNEMFPFQIF